MDCGYDGVHQWYCTAVIIASPGCFSHLLPPLLALSHSRRRRQLEVAGVMELGFLHLPLSFWRTSCSTVGNTLLVGLLSRLGDGLPMDDRFPHAAFQHVVGTCSPTSTSDTTWTRSWPRCHSRHIANWKGVRSDLSSCDEFKRSWSCQSWLVDCILSASCRGSWNLSVTSSFT